MSIRLARSAGWAAYVSGMAAILGMVSLLLFFTLESTPNSESGPHVWGPISDICPIVQMVSLLVVARALHLTQRTGAPGFSLVTVAIGLAGMLGVTLLQLLLRLGVIAFEQEVVPVTLATGVVGVWLILVSHVGRRSGNLPSRLAWLGIAVGVAFVLEPVMLFVAGGAASWRAIMSNYLLLTASAVVFLVSYVGFPVWAIWFGRMVLRTARAPATLLAQKKTLDV